MGETIQSILAGASLLCRIWILILAIRALKIREPREITHSLS
jgi:hypothetical protein